MSASKPNFPKWFRDRGYLHLTEKQSTRGKDAQKLLQKLREEKDYVARHAFVPLIHTSITERRYKRLAPERPERAHSSFKNETVKHYAKSRPLHYASHRDALIFGCYSEILQERYEAIIKAEPELDAAIIGYRKIKSGKLKLNGDPINKGTMHFASEAFREISERSNGNGCTVLKFDIEKFFSSMDHKRLLRAWAELFGREKLEDDHYNVFKAATRMHYVLLDDLRKYQAKKGRCAGFDEQHLARMRSRGTEAFYFSVQELRKAIREGDITVYKAPFTKKANSKNANGETWIAKGIPQGLPISSTLANIYLLAFDRAIVETLVKDENKGCYYRRYSDDLIIICKPEQAEEVKSFVLNTIEESEVTISSEKTEEFWFRQWPANQYSQRLTSIRKGQCFKSTIGHPFTFLGFEFYGYQTLIKSANLAKFYRRMIYAVKRKAKRALKIAEATGTKPILFHNQLYRLYTTKDLRKTEIRRNNKRLVPDRKGVYRYEVWPKKPKALRSNYLTYVRRAAQILDDKKIEKQIRSHKAIYLQAVKRHFISKVVAR